MPRNQDRGYDLIRFVLTWAIFVHHVLTTAVSCGIPKPYVLNGVFYRLGGGFGRAAVSMFFMLSGARKSFFPIIITASSSCWSRCGSARSRWSSSIT